MATTALPSGRPGLVRLLAPVLLMALLAPASASAQRSQTLSRLNPTVAGGNAQAVAVDDARGRVFVANTDEGSVSVHDSRSGKELGRIPGVRTPMALALDASAGLVFVTENRSNTVATIDARQLRLTGRRIPVGRGPRGIAVDPVSDVIYVANSDDDTVTLIKGGRTGGGPGAVLGHVPVKDGPYAIAVAGFSGHVYVSCRRGDSVTVLDGSAARSGSARTLALLRVGSRPGGLAYDTNRERVYVANSGSDDVSVIDDPTLTVVGPPIAVQSQPHAVAIDPRSNIAYVANNGDSSISLLDTVARQPAEAVIGNASSMSAPGMAALAVSAKTGLVYSADGNANTLTRLVRTVVNNFPSAGSLSLRQVAVDAGLRRTFVAVQSDGHIAVLTSRDGRLLHDVPAPSPNALAVNSPAHRLFATASGASMFLTIDTVDTSTGAAAVLSIASLGLSDGVAANPDTNTVYLALKDRNVLAVLDGTSGNLRGEIPTGRTPVAVAVNRDKNTVYVANEDDDTVTIYDGATNVARGQPVRFPVSIPGVFGKPSALAVDEKTGIVYVALPGLGLVAAFDGLSVAGGAGARIGLPIPVVALNKGGLALDSRARRLYVATAWGVVIVGISSRSGGPSAVIDALVPGTIFGVAIDRDQLFVTSSDGLRQFALASLP